MKNCYASLIKSAVVALMIMMFFTGAAQENKMTSRTTFRHKIDYRQTPVKAKQARMKAREILKLKNQEDIVLFKTEKDPTGFIHERYQKTYMGIPIENSVVLIHYNKNGLAHLINGEDHPVSTGTATKPVLSESDALAMARQYINASVYAWDAKIKNPMPVPKGTLVLYEGVLAYKFGINAIEPMSSDWVYVNASTGKILGKISGIVHAIGSAETNYSGTQAISTTTNTSGQYILHDYTRGKGIFTYNLNHSGLDVDTVDFTDNDNNWTAAEFDNAQKDIGAFDAFWALEMSYDYWKNVHGRDSYDGKGSPIISSIHFRNDFINAVWSNLTQKIYFGATFSGYPMTELDVVAHELGHGILFSFGLASYGETNILHEGISDIFAACVSNYVNNHAALPVQKDIWEYGEASLGIYMRHFSTPMTYYKNYWLPSSNESYIYSNSLVLRYWFYLLTQGGSGKNDYLQDYNVPAQGIDITEQIIYNSMFYMPPCASISDMETATLQAVENLTSKGSLLYQATLKAWNAVGVINDLPDLSCVPSSLNGMNNAIWFNKVIVSKDITGLVGLPPYGYVHETGDRLNISPGTTVPITLQVTGESLAKYFKIWVDMNRDGIFEPSEVIFQADSIVGEQVTGSASIPAGISIGDSRMRVGVSNFPFASCDIVPSGEFRDYDINLIPFSDNYQEKGYCIPWRTDDLAENMGKVKIGSREYNGNISGYGAVYEGYDLGESILNVWITETNSIKIFPIKTDLPILEEYVNIWIDLNQNKIFEPNEIVFEGHSKDSIISDFTIPSYALTGNTRMRIAMSRNSYAADPCIPVEYGEMFDISLNIHPSSELVSTDGYCTPRGSCAFGDVTQPNNFNINSFTIGPKTDIYSGNQNFGYADYTKDSFLFEAGHIYPLTLIAHSPGAYWRVWIDSNNDKMFEDNEIAYENATPAKSTTLQASLTVAPDAIPGITRIRVVASFFFPYPGLCKTVEYGQIMDVTAVIQSNLNPCPAPSALTITNITSATAHLSWTPGPSDDYEIQYRLSGDIFWQSVLTGGPVLYDLNVLPGSFYEVKVRGICGASTVSDWLTQSFYVPCPDVPIVSISNVSIYSADVDWTPVLLTGNDTLEYSTDMVNWTFEKLNGITFEKLTTLLPHTQYFVRIKRHCKSDLYYSDIVTFTTSCPTPPENIQVTELYYNSATVTWDPVQDQAKYLFQYRISGQTAWNPGIEKYDTKITLENLVPGPTYEYQVASDTLNCPFSSSDWSVTKTFLTSIRPGTNFVYPIDMGMINIGKSHSDTENNSPENGFMNDYGQASDDIFYVFTIKQSSVVTIDNSNSGISSSCFYLCDKGYKQLASTIDNGPLRASHKATLTMNLVAGKYFIISEGIGSITGDITTNVRLKACTKGAPGVSMKSAIPVINSNKCPGFSDIQNNGACFENYSKKLGPAIYYKLSLSKSSRVKIQSCVADASMTSALYLLKENGKEIANCSENGPFCMSKNSSLMEKSLPIGDYYIVVVGKNNYTGVITLNVFSGICPKKSMKIDEMDIADTLNINTPLDEPSIVSDITLFPNPTNGNINLIIPQLSNPALVTVSDIDGRLLKNVQVSTPETTINTSGLANGIYLVSIHLSSGVVCKRLEVLK
jgi:bacillolysin